MEPIVVQIVQSAVAVAVEIAALVVVAIAVAGWPQRGLVGEAW